MWKKLFSNNAANKVGSDLQNKKEALDRALAEAKKKDPMAGVRMGARDLVQLMLVVIKDDRGVHVESLLGATASLGGFASQMAIREEYVKTGKTSLTQIMMEVGTESGEKFYFGDSINRFVMEDKYSIYSLTGGAVQSLGCTEFPDIHEISKYYANMVGSKEFGVPRLPEGHQMSDLPVNYIRDLWPVIVKLLNDYCDNPLQWPILIGLAIQNMIEMAKDSIEPKLAFYIVMECAIPSSKFDPVALGVAI